MGRLGLNRFWPNDRPAPFLDRARGGRSSDPKQRSDSARHGESGADHHHPAKSGHKRFIDCATD
jgi:hypothetical protein